MGFFSGKPTPTLVTQKHIHTTGDHSYAYQGSELTNTDDVKTVVMDFINRRPLEMFVIDGKKGEPDSIIVLGKETFRVPADFVTLFKTMQNMNFYCSLPHDVDATHFECRPIE